MSCGDIRKFILRGGALGTAVAEAANLSPRSLPLVSGVARTAEALLKAVAIAAGVGVVIALWR